ncbi:MAG: glycosyltransferase family 9 protein [Nitrospirota bacterium]
MRHKVFVYHGGALGDLLLSLPAIKTMKKADDFVHLAGHPDAADFLMKAGFIHEKSDVNSRLLLSLFTDKSEDGIIDFLQGFDRVCVFTSNRHSLLSENILAIFPHAEIIQTIPPEGLKMHVSDFRKGQLGGKGILDQQICRPLMFLDIPPIYKDKARNMLVSYGYDFNRPIAAIHTGSGSIRKNWPLERFAGVIERMQKEKDYFFMLFSGPAENEEMKKEIEYLAARLGKQCIYIPDLELMMIAALLNLCGIYLGNDSGFTHLASLFAENTIAVFGPTDPVLWSPVNKRSIVISSDAECSPCGQIYKGGVSDKSSRECDSRCLSDISVQRVFEEIMRTGA